MKKSKEKVFRSVVATKITKKMFFVYGCIYLIILTLLLLIISPMLINVADSKAQNASSMMYDEIASAQSALSDYTNTLSYSDALLGSLEKYNNAATDQNKAYIEQALSNYVASNNLLLAASLEDFDHNYFSSSYFQHIVNKESTLADDHYQRLFNYPNGSYFSFIPADRFKTETGTYDIGAYSYHTLVFTKIMYFNTKPYILQSFYSINTVFSHCEKLTTDIFSNYALLDQDKDFLFSSTENFQNNSFFQDSSMHFTKTFEKETTSGGVYYIRNNPSTQWMLVAYAPYMLYLQSVFTILGLITLLYLISPVLYALFLIPSTTKLLSPLGKLHDAMKYYTTGDKITLEINTQDEIEDLSHIFNEMVVKINAQINEIRNKEHVNSVVNYKLLATQIDPHFIYNTMNIINIMARQGNTTAIVEINSALIKILRERLNSKLSISETIENELDTLYQYNLIMDYRYENKVTLQVDMDDTLKYCIIPKNILQPLAENAFYHGFASLKDDEDGHISILIYSVEEQLIIEISDDGTGIPEERLNMIRNHSYHIYDDKKPHIGLDNIRQRLEYVYKGNYQFDIHSTLGFGTTISITIPLEK
ncbi:MAG: histidine kinase [Lachnospiraceae bacterium]|nr:histidine kinase [Lachnospiraceae bacterium]